MSHISLIGGHQSALIRIARLHEIRKVSSDKTITQILFQKI